MRKRVTESIDVLWYVARRHLARDNVIGQAEAPDFVLSFGQTFDRAGCSLRIGYRHRLVSKRRPPPFNGCELFLDSPFKPVGNGQRFTFSAFIKVRGYRLPGVVGELQIGG
ncbi:MAG TPA: hypothetical protein VJR71_17740 [Pseudolabrys sp.]|nr:hypothetical protein [Pseudolabrys sp.]